MILSTPNNTRAEVLFELIKKGSVSMKEFSWMEGFRTRVSELNKKHLIPLLTTREKGENKHGNAIWYKRHSLPLDQIDFALGVYNKINKS
jgi:two-component SAPR family response regulator